MNRIAIGALAGWSAIVGLAWWLADRRIDVCLYSDERCKPALLAARDNVLIHGLTVALVGIVGLTLWAPRSRRRWVRSPVFWRGWSCLVA